jgi:hypothetical protein
MSALLSPARSEFSARKSIIDRPSRGRTGARAFVRFLVAICIGVVGTLAWQSYGDATKRIIATRAPELGWSPEAKQMIASWIEELGWTKPQSAIIAVRQSAPATPAATVAQTLPETVVPKASAAPSLELEQVQQMAKDLAEVRQAIVQLGAGQEQMARDMAKLQATNQGILDKVTPPPPPRPATPAPKRMSPSPGSSGAPMPLH